MSICNYDKVFYLYFHADGQSLRLIQGLLYEYDCHMLMVSSSDFTLLALNFYESEFINIQN